MDCAQRFWNKVDKSGGPDACWEWKAFRTKAGYGQFRAGKKLFSAHRFAWKLVHGPIPDGELGRRFGVDKTTIGFVVRGDHWRDVGYVVSCL